MLHVCMHWLFFVPLLEAVPNVRVSDQDNNELQTFKACNEQAKRTTYDGKGFTNDT